MPDDKTRLELPVELAERIRRELVELYNASPSVLLLSDEEISAAFYAAAEGLQEMKRAILKNEVQKFMTEWTRVMTAAIREKLQELGEASFKEKAALVGEEIVKELTDEWKKEFGQLDKEGIKARLLAELRRSLKPMQAPILAAQEPIIPVRGPAEVNIQNIGIAEQIRSLHDKLSARAKEFGIKCPQLPLPPVISDITLVHLEAMEAVFGKGNLEPLVLPDLDDLNDDYFNMMYPPVQRQEDMLRGLIVQNANPKSGPRFASLKIDAKTLKGALIFIETIQKPQRLDLGGFYGSADGRDATKDDIYKMILKNRFGLSWAEIKRVVAVFVERRLANVFKSRNLAIPAFEVILQPALASNLSTVLNHPENSQGPGFEWSSTHLLGEPEQYLTICGESPDGAGRLGNDMSNSTMPNRAFRLAVVFRK